MVSCIIVETRFRLLYVRQFLIKLFLVVTVKKKIIRCIGEREEKSSP